MIRPTADNPPLRVFVSPADSGVRIRRFKSIHTAPGPLDRAAEKTLIESEMTRVKRSLTDDLATALSSSTVFVPVARDDAEIAIHVKLEAYGRVPGKWLVVLVGSGVVEAFAQGFIVERVTRNQWLALAVGAEELTSECVTWLGGAFVTNRFLTPILLSCRVVRVRDHRTIWKKHIATIYSRKIIARLPRDQRRRREAQLAALTAHAVDELGVSLRKAWPTIARRARSNGKGARTAAARR